ncbi:MAG: hypothetical protein SPI68_09310 [Candidatus Faecousia sp.]|nr:hypothetical protein [Eubacteriales bacterium]MDY6067863.1 hypothetical protein [Candidatus Faecousia sp.]
MSMEIYPIDFHTRYEITHAISIVMTVYYNDIGKLTLVADIDEYNVHALKIGNLLYDTARDITFLIACVNIDTKTNRITANGFTANWILNKRCIASDFHMVNIEQGAYQMVADNLRGLTRVRMAAAIGLTERTDHIFKGGLLLDELIPFLEEKGLGHKMLWHPDIKEHEFKIYKGIDRTQGIHAVRFSDEQGSAKDLVINDDDSTLCNVAYVSGSLKDDAEFVEIIGDAVGDNRREIWFDTAVTQEQDETEADCKARARAYGSMELGKRIRRQSFGVVIDPEDLGKFYDLGDVVTCVSVRFGVSFNARITGLRYTLDSSKTKTEIILGDPILTALGVMKLNG